jgi:YHS domain-containing protein
MSLEGHFPICFLDARKGVKGGAEYRVVHNGRAYNFPGPKHKEKVLATPARHVPALGGNRAVSYSQMREQRDVFSASPEKYTKLR